MPDVLSLEECDRILEHRRLFGDLHPDRLKEEQERFFASISHLRRVK
jgi:hypothetical protein